MGDEGLCPSCGAARGTVPVDTSASPFLGRTVGGKFVLRDVVGAGAMGTVFRADQTSLGRTVAVKLLNATLARDESMVRRFHAEARAASRINHPNTIAIIDFGQTPDRLLYLVMEFVRGRTLTEVIRQEFPLAQARLVDIVCQVLAGLHEAHSQGVIHQDVKPDNILVELLRTGGDLVKIADFGIARLREEEPPPGAGEAPVVCGTPDYMPPEQIRGQAVDARSDVYAAGVVLYEMLTGERPFSGGPAEVLRAHLNDPPPPPRARRPDVVISPAIEAVALKALTKDPAARYESAAEFRQALEECLSLAPQSGVSCRVCAMALPPGSLYCFGCGARVGGGLEPPPAVDPRGQTMPAMQSSPGILAPLATDSRFPLPFVDRATEMRHVERMLAARERARGLVVLGAPGMGKTRLCTEASARAVAAGYRVLAFRPDPSGLATTWFPVRAAVAQLLGLPRDVGRQALSSGLAAAGIDESNAHGLADLFGLGAPVTGVELAVRRRECAAAALSVLRGTRDWPPTLLVFEDVESYDQPSLDLLQRLVEFPGEVPIHVLLTSVPGSEVEWLEGVEVLSLEGLSFEAAREALQRIVGDGTHVESLCRSLYRESAGVPLHLEQALRLELEGGVAGDVPLPDIIAGRIEALPLGARWALQAAAVHGLVTPTSVLDALLADEADLDAALGVLTARGLLEVGSGMAQYAHPLVRDVVLAGIPVDARRRFHARLYELLSASGGTPALVGYHGYCAGAGARAQASLERAGLEAQRAFDDAGAVLHYRRAWEMARWAVLRGDDDAETGMARIGVLLGEAMRYAGDLAAAEGVLRETLERCANDRVATARAWRALAHLAAAGGQPAERVRQYARTALGQALRAGDRELVAWVYLDLSTFLEREGDLEAAAHELQEGLLLVTGGEGATSIDGPEVTWRLAMRLAELLVARGQAPEALACAEAALFQAERVGSPVGAARSHVILGEVHAALGRHDESAAHRTRAVAWMRTFGDRRSTAELLFALAREDIESGAVSQARARLLEASQLAKALEWNDGVAQSASTLNTIAS